MHRVEKVMNGTVTQPGFPQPAALFYGKPGLNCRGVYGSALLCLLAVFTVFVTRDQSTGMLIEDMCCLFETTTNHDRNFTKDWAFPDSLADTLPALSTSLVPAWIGAHAYGSSGASQ